MLLYDLEIQNLVPSKNADNLPDFKYCSGWTDYVGMGFACAVTYDTARAEYRLFDEFMLDELQKRINRTDVVVGFNINRFDNNVLAAYEIQIPPAKCYDLLAEIARAAGTPNDYSGLSLDAVCRANFNITKTGDGAEAPKLYQQKRLGELFDYCLADVRLTKRIFDRIMEMGHIINPRNNQWIRVNRPR